MTTQEFSIEFDILYNNLASNAAPPLNDYEKSVFLTKAQSDIVIELYSGRNNLGLSYESSEEVRKYLEKLNATDTPTLNQSGKITYGDSPIWLVTMETYKGIPVIPVTQDEYLKIKQNPFKQANSLRRVLRIRKGDADYLDTQNALSTSDLSSYTVFGLRKPKPIILDSIGDPTLTIEDISVSIPSTSELDPSIHRMILDRAVLYAKQAYVGGQTQE